MEKTPPPVPSASTPSTDKGGEGLPKSFADLETKRGNPRGVKPGSTRGAYKKRDSSGSPTDTQEPLPGTQFTPENCKYLVALPFNLAFVRTGYTGFQLQETECETLSASAATVLNVWVNIDPKWAALMMFAISLASISAAKIMGYKVALAEIEAQKARAAEATNGHKPAGTN